MITLEVTKIQEKIREISKARDWDQFHTAKNLAAALSVEAGELLEIFQWLTEKQSNDLKGDDVKLEPIADELSDILYFVMRLSDVLEIDINKAFWKKLAKSEAKYPVDKAKGNAKKYTEF